jgi:hypothetical protein
MNQLRQYTKTQIALANRAIGRITQCGFSPDTLTDNDLLEFQGVGPKTIPLIRELCSAKAAEPKPTTVTIPLSLGQDLAVLVSNYIQLIENKIKHLLDSGDTDFDSKVLRCGLLCELDIAHRIYGELNAAGIV